MEFGFHQVFIKENISDYFKWKSKLQVFKTMLLDWESKVLNRIYKTGFFNSLRGMFSSLQTFDYSKITNLYDQFCQKQQRDKADLKFAEGRIDTLNGIVRQQKSSYDVYPYILTLGELYTQRKPESPFTLMDVLTVSSLSKCKIWPKLFKTNSQNQKLSGMVCLYRTFVDEFKNDLDFKFDPVILSAKYTKIMEKSKLKKKTNVVFLDHVAMNRFEEVQKAVQDNPEVMEAIEMTMEKQAPHVAAEKSSLDMLKLLYKLGANFECTDKELQTPIFYAVMRGDLPIVQFLVDVVKVNIQHQQHQKRSPLYLSAFKGNTPIVKFLHQRGANINNQSSLGRTPLSKSCYLGNIQTTKYLLDAKADMLIKDVKGRTPLHNAAWGREGGRDGKKSGNAILDDSPECVQLLLDYGHPIDQPDLDGFTPFFSSVSSNGFKSFNVLLKNGANIHHLTNKGENACLIAAKYGHLQTLRPLIQQHKLDFNLRDSLQLSSLQAAAISDCSDPLKCFKYLTQKVFSPQNDKLRSFTFQNFFLATEYHKKQDFIMYLIRNEKIQQCLRNILRRERLEKLLEDALKLKEENYVEFVKWVGEQMGDKDWEQLVNMLLRVRRFAVLQRILGGKSTEEVRLHHLRDSLKEEMSDQLLKLLLQMDSDCTSTEQKIEQLLTILVLQRRTKVLLDIFQSPPVTDNPKGIHRWNKMTLAQIVTRKSEDKLSIVQYCEINHYRDLSTLLEKIALQLLHEDKDALLGFKIPQYKVQVQHRWKKQVVIPKSQQHSLFEYLTDRQKDFLQQFNHCQTSHSQFIQKHKSHHEVLLVNTPQSLKQLLLATEKYNLWGVDVQYYSEQHSFICTLQLSNIDTTYIVDALLLRQLIPTLDRLFSDPKIIKIFHGCENDLRWLCEDFTFKTTGIFDTCKTYMMINNEMNSPSLKKLVEGELAYNMDKDFQMSDWRVRPLLKEMVDYARMDAEILLYLFAKLTHAADKKGMIRQVQEQCFKERKLNLKGKHLEITLEK